MSGADTELLAVISVSSFIIEIDTSDTPLLLFAPKFVVLSVSCSSIMSDQVHSEHCRVAGGEAMYELIAVPELGAQGTETVLVLSPGPGEVDVVIRIIHEIASSLYHLEVEKYKNHSLRLVFKNTGS